MNFVRWYEARMACFRRIVLCFSVGSLATMAGACSPDTANRPRAQISESPLADANGSLARAALSVATPPTKDVDPEPQEEMPRSLRRCFSSLPVWTRASVPDLLDQSEQFLESNDPEGALACAEEAARQAPTSIDAHHDRAAAFLRMRRYESAQSAITLALALDPTDSTALVFAADLYINHLPSSSQNASIGLQYVYRASRNGASGRSSRIRLALLEGQSLIDLGRSKDSLVPLGRALSLANSLETKVAVAYELGVAQFELCRLADARNRFDWVLQNSPKHAQAHFHLALVLERAGVSELAKVHFAEATQADGVAFPAGITMENEAFDELVRQSVATLPSALQESVRDIPIETFDLPDLADLTAESPPLSPTILGLFRGIPLGYGDRPVPTRNVKARPSLPRREARSGTSTAPPPSEFSRPERVIFIYRRNILRSLKSEKDVKAAIRRTLLHELGHVLGEDDGSLRDRGLE
jgi:predicted Zn-dependent protease with MMP-like domain/Flp pilus assembly protein TadD